MLMVEENIVEIWDLTPRIIVGPVVCLFLKSHLRVFLWYNFKEKCTVQTLENQSCDWQGLLWMLSIFLILSGLNPIAAATVVSISIHSDNKQPKDTLKVLFCLFASGSFSKSQNTSQSQKDIMSTGSKCFLQPVRNQIQYKKPGGFYRASWNLKRLIPYFTLQQPLQQLFHCLFLPFLSHLYFFFTLPLRDDWCKLSADMSVPLTSIFIGNWSKRVYHLKSELNKFKISNLHSI